MTTDELKSHMDKVLGEPCGKTLAECQRPWNHRRYANLKAELDRLDEDVIILNRKDADESDPQNPKA